eukprot:TRINITY_DN2595_c0_g1_i16.p1 TRINITY_DN2595_c0_g1~~TRINITY_DN2595_c0_g1_i16.p1  ORF type:complete len:584 (-),score=166.93 TRINITY_DN2595_c0_g1_i16:214-1965(-)
MEKKEGNGCEAHPGEKKKLFCCEPCKVSLCQYCLKNHKKHDVRALAEIVDEVSYRFEKVKIEKNTASTLCMNQIEAIDKFISEFEDLIVSYEKEEKQMIKLVTEPFNEIVQQFKDKVADFVGSLREKKETCMTIYEKASTEMVAVDSKIKSIEDLVKAECTDDVFQQWLLGASGHGFQHIPESEYVLDIDTIRHHCDALKSVNVSEQLKILAQFFVNALRDSSADPLSKIIDTSSSKTRELKVLCERVTGEQAMVKGVLNSAEEMKKKIRTALNTATELQKKDEPENIKELINKNEEVVKIISREFIANVKAANAAYSELTKSRKEIEDMQMSYSKTIVEWKKGIQMCEGLSVNLKKHLARFKFVMDDYSKDIVRLNNQYTITLKDFEDLSNKFQAMRTTLITTESTTRNYEMKISIVSLNKSQSAALRVLRNFLADSLGSDVGESFTEAKNYNRSVKLGNCSAEFFLQYLGTVENVKDADPAYYQSAEYVLLVYEVGEESEILKRVEEFMELVKGKTEAAFILSGIARDKQVNDASKEGIAEYAKSMAIPFKLVSDKKEEIEKLFYEALSNKFPELRKKTIN